MNLFMNLKNNKFYVVCGVATDATNARQGSKVVMYAESGGSEMFVRDEEEFKEKFVEVDLLDPEVNKKIAAALV